MGGERLEVPAAFSLEGDASDGAQFGFHVGAYDQRKVLVLDPVILLYAGYIGGSGSERGLGIAVDSTGNAYVTGHTRSTEATFPVTVGPDLTFNGGSHSFPTDAFVAKVNPSGTALVYAGYIGGSGADYGQGIAVDSTGAAYVTGETGSTNFPTTAGAFNTTGTGSFVTKLNPAGTALVYSTILVDASTTSIAVDSTGNAYVTGETGCFSDGLRSIPISCSDEATFPVTVGPDLTYNGTAACRTCSDAFVAKVNPSGTALLYAGYIGGEFDDSGRGIAVDSAGNAYITGFTTSRESGYALDSRDPNI